MSFPSMLQSCVVSYKSRFFGTTVPGMIDGTWYVRYLQTMMNRRCRVKYMTNRFIIGPSHKTLYVVICNKSTAIAPIHDEFLW
jgi:hypothetical protein